MGTEPCIECGTETDHECDDCLDAVCEDCVEDHDEWEHSDQESCF